MRRTEKRWGNISTDAAYMKETSKSGPWMP